MILSHQSIMKRQPIFEPVKRTEVLLGDQKTTYGCGPAGYDLRLDNVKSSSIIEGEEGLYWFLNPGQFLLASAVEKFQMPDDVLGIVHDKSSWARRGLAMQNTVIEPGWNGFLTLEITNHGNEVIKLVQGCGICQVIFHLLDEASDQPYNGKYQNQQAGPQEAR